MPAVWFALKRSFDCKTDPSEVHDPTKNLNTIRSGCSRSITNLRDIIHSSKRHTHGLGGGCSSPKSIGSSQVLDPMSRQVIVNESTCELQITGFGFGAKKGANFKGTHKKQGTSGSRALSNHGGSSVFRASHGSSGLTCQNCGKQLKDMEAFELHHLSMHSVTELAEGDSSRKIVELICGSRLMSRSEDRVLKVHNMQKTLAQFEEYREMVKIRGSKLANKHPRCLADGNELLRFYGTVVACSLGTNGSLGLCTLERCGVCNILRHGFSSNGVGVFTTSTSLRALESVELCRGKYSKYKSVRRALIVCRVIAGRVHRPLENHEELMSVSGFDSLAGKLDRDSNMEELYLFSPKALLPCFVVVCTS